LRKVLINDQLVDEVNAKLSIYDSALMFGDMVFEMTRSFNKKQFKLEEHIDRLLTGIKILRIPLQYSKNEIIEKCNMVIEANDPLFSDDDEHRLMIDVTRGLLGIYEGIEGIKSGPNLIIADFPLRWTVRGMGELFDRGINAVITSQRAIPARLLDPKIKNRSRLFYLNANMEASLFEGSNNWALLLDEDGFITEGTGDNFFIIKDKTVISPEGRNILRGISRDYVLEELCSLLGLNYKEKNIEPYDVYTADEAFMTGTPFCMLPVVSLNSIQIGNGKPGAIYNEILSKWSSEQSVDIPKQIKEWNKADPKEKVMSPYSFKK
jgi:branched-chain amino acid aminotransferase